VLVPATSISFLTLDEAKLLLGLPAGAATSDEQLQFYIDVASATIARHCNRMFAQETVAESWRDLGGNRIFLTHYPVKAADIETVTVGDADTLIDPADWDLEEATGKLSNYTTNAWPEPVTITYTGGYLLPDDAPLPLKQATVLLGRDQYWSYRRAALTGVKSIAHKEARVQYMEGPATASMQGGGAGVVMPPPVSSLLVHYVRFPV
jgi:hypothetical protein